MKRRDFSKLLFGGLGGLAAAPALLGALSKDAWSAAKTKLRIGYAPPADPTKKWGMAIDVDKCTGCRICAYACRDENNIGRDSGFGWIELHKIDRGTMSVDNSDTTYTEAGDPDSWYLPHACMQCEDAPCVASCPVQATWQEDDGIVVVDYDKCIGCRYCMVNCPYDARYFNWTAPSVPAGDQNEAVPMRDSGVVEKCTFCVHRTRKGLLPACVEACPVGARTFGDLNDEESPVSRLLRTRVTVRLKEHLGTKPRVFYVG